MGHSLSSVVSNIFMENSEEIALDTADYKPTKRLLRRRHFRGLVTWTSKTAAISSPPQQPQIYHEIQNASRSQ
jgi:hypothetical protein